MIRRTIVSLLLTAFLPSVSFFQAQQRKHTN